MLKILLGIITVAGATSYISASEYKAVSENTACIQKNSEEDYFPTETEWSQLMSNAVATGEIAQSEVITYAELEVCEYKWQGRRESTNVEDRRRWKAREWLWWATNIGQY